MVKRGMSEDPKKANRKRAAFACKPCNARRLKCDAVENGWPCSRCRSLGREADCELHQSRRGKYPRIRKNSKDTLHSTSAETPHGTGGEELSAPSPLAIISDVAAARTPLLPISSTKETEKMFFDNNSGWVGSVTSQDTTSNDNDQSNNELRETSPAFSTRPPSPKAPMDMVYANLLDEDRRVQQPSQSILYMGLPTHNLSYLLSRKDGPAPPCLHYPMLESLSARRPLSPQELALYKGRGDCILPEEEIQDELIRTYFAVIQPTYPILDRVQFAKSYRNKDSPPSMLLLQAMFMHAASHCSLDLLLKAGFKSRHEAKRSFYRRAKALYDSDFETNRLVNIQATYLLQFWWDSPLEQKDAGYWLGVSILLAQGCGMHRSTERACLCPIDRRLWRRIWAGLCMRDAHTALAFGKPLQIQEFDCDVEPLTEADFIEEGIETIDQNFFGRFTRQHILYAINIWRLHQSAVLICQAHAPKLSMDRIVEAQRSMQLWSQTIEPEMQYESNLHPDFWVRILHIFSSYLTILIQRAMPSSSDRTAMHSAQALRAANFTNLLFDELLTENEIHLCPTHLVPALFAAMSIHLSMAGFLDPISKVDRIAKHRLRVSMTAMKELSAYWPVCTWIFQLFTKIIKERSGHANQQNNEIASSSTRPCPSEPSGVSAPNSVKSYDDTFGNWAEIEEFSSALGMTEGMDFDFSHMFDSGFESVMGLNIDTPAVGTRDSSFPSFLEGGQ